MLQTIMPSEWFIIVLIDLLYVLWFCGDQGSCSSLTGGWRKLSSVCRRQELSSPPHTQCCCSRPVWLSLGAMTQRPRACTMKLSPSTPEDIIYCCTWWVTHIHRHMLCITRLSGSNWRAAVAWQVCQKNYPAFFQFLNMSFEKWIVFLTASPLVRLKRMLAESEILLAGWTKLLMSDGSRPASVLLSFLLSFHQSNGFIMASKWPWRGQPLISTAVYW